MKLESQKSIERVMANAYENCQLGVEQLITTISTVRRKDATPQQTWSALLASLPKTCPEEQRVGYLAMALLMLIQQTERVGGDLPAHDETAGNLIQDKLAELFESLKRFVDGKVHCTTGEMWKHASLGLRLRGSLHGSADLPELLAMALTLLVKAELEQEQAQTKPTWRVSL